MVGIKERIDLSKFKNLKHKKMIVAVIAVITIIAILLAALINSYGVVGYLQSPTSFSRYIKVKYTYTQDKSSADGKGNTISMIVNYFRIYNVSDESNFSCSAPLELRYGKQGGTATQYRQYTATKTYKADTTGYEGLSDLAGWTLKSAVIPQDRGRPVTLHVYGKCDLRAVSKGNHWDGEFFEVPGYNGGSTPVTTDVKWVDDDNRDGKRPASITATIHRKVSNTTYGAEAKDFTRTIVEGSKTVGNYAYGFGATYTYTVTYPDVPNYTKSVSGNTVTYTYTPQKITPKATVVWNDNNNAGGIRPAKVSLVLSVNSEKVISDANAANSWIADFGVQFTYEGGKIRTFSLSAPDVDGYKKAVSGNATDGYKVIYTYIPGQSVAPGFAI